MDSSVKFDERNKRFGKEVWGGMQIRETMFFCEREGLKIRGMEFLPDETAEGKKYPVIIVSHGFTGDYTGEADYCRDFAKLGYAAYSFSFCGGTRTLAPEEWKSEGKTTDATIWTEVADLIAVKDYVKSLPYIDTKRLILMGCSQGGMVSGLAAAKCGEEIYKLIMVYPALCIPDHARLGCLGGARYDVDDVPEIIDCGSILLGKKFHDTTVGMDVFLELRAYKGSVLILQGWNDMVVNYSYAIRAKENYGPGQCHLQMIRDMGHGADEGQRGSIVASCQEFLLGHREVLTIRVILTRSESRQREEYLENKVYFTGYCDTEYFHGTILPEGCDLQKHYADGVCELCADYRLEGVDNEGERCSIHIVNRNVDGKWKPTIETDSKALAWMENSDATAVLEGNREGPMVRIFFAELLPID